jgi:hypothetical protein
VHELEISDPSRFKISVAIADVMRLLITLVAIAFLLSSPSRGIGWGQLGLVFLPLMYVPGDDGLGSMDRCIKRFPFTTITLCPSYSELLIVSLSSLAKANRHRALVYVVSRPAVQIGTRMCSAPRRAQGCQTACSETPGFSAIVLRKTVGFCGCCFLSSIIYACQDTFKISQD